jgi:hypothetical protein
LQPSADYGLLGSGGSLITHNDAPQSVGLLWTSDQLVAETSTWQHTTHTTDNRLNIHAPGGIRTHDRSRRAAVDLSLRPSGYWERHSKTLPTLNEVIIQCTVQCIVHLLCTVCLSCTYKSKGFWRFRRGYGDKEDESSTGCVWAAVFHDVTACSRLAGVLKLTKRLFIYFSNFFFGSR